MVGRTEYSSVPTAVDLENNSNQKKYTVNRRPDGLVISKPLCALMAIGTLLLALLVGLLVFFLVPRCSEATTEPYYSSQNSDSTVSDHGSPESPRTADSKEVDERLPRSVAPTEYRIQIRPYLDNQTMDGSVTMNLVVKEETNEIVFHVKDIEIDKKSVKVRSSKSDEPLEITNQDYIEGERYKIVLDQPLVKNIIYTLDMTYVGHLNNHLQGFYRSEYMENEKKEYLASTQFSPTDARRAFPCFDEPSFKANFTIVLARPLNMSSLSNMEVEKSHHDVDHPGWMIDYYKTTPKMSTYLVAFVVSNLQGYGASKSIKIWSRRENIMNSEMAYASEFAPKVLDFFENYFKSTFPLSKMDIVTIPDFGFNAMENWGLITFRESALLYKERESDINNKRDIATILAHELAHQWFGNLVTLKWWNDLWLKEGFATYLQYLGTGYAEPSWMISQEFIISETSRAFALDALESSRPISFDVNNNRQIRQTFDELSYGKGACIVRMMNHFLGEDTFKAGLINFLQKYKYSNADRNDLFEVLTEEAHRSGAMEKSMTVKDVMDSWTRQPGFPVVTAIADRANKKLILSQKRFLFTGNDNNATWWVPISVVTDVNATFDHTKPTVWLKNEPMVAVNLDMDQWYIVNVNQTGYFIVNYDEMNWRKLTENIMELPALTRAQLISDSMDLARANLLSYDIPLKMIARMAVRDAAIMFIPTSVAFKKLEYLSDMLSSTPIFGMFEEYIWTIFKNTYRQVKSDTDYYSENYLKQRIRKAVLKWSCRRTDGDCAIEAHLQYRKWMERDERVPPNLREIVYCTAIRQGTEAEWNFAHYQFLQSTSASQKNMLLDAMGCTTKRWLLSRYLDVLVRNESSIKIQDASRVFKSVADNSVTNTLAFDFLRMNWDKLLAHYGEGFNIISKMVKSLPRYMNTDYQLSELIRFKNEIKGNMGTTSQAFDSAIETVKGNVLWMKRNYHSVEKWLKDYREHYNLF